MKHMILKIGRKKVIAGFILLAAGIACLILTGSRLITYSRGATELPQGIHLADYEGEYVTYTIKYPLEAYVQESVRMEDEVHQDAGQQDASRLGYVVWDENYDDYICVRVPVEKMDEMNYLQEQTWNYLTGETSEDVSGSLDVTGTIEYMTAQELELYKQTLDTMFGEGYAEEITKAYYIDDGRIHGSSVRSIVFLSIMAAGCLVSAMGILIYSFKSSAIKVDSDEGVHKVKE